ncbi:MAG: recombinase family protein [Pseudomonadota bacterium]
MPIKTKPPIPRKPVAIATAPAPMKTTACAIYARVSTKPKAECPTCEKIVRCIDGVIQPHRNASDTACKGGGATIESEARRGQDTENQLLQLREYCARSGWRIAIEYIDRESAKSGERDAFKQLFEDASRRMFDVVLVWALDRFTREGVFETFDYVRKLTLAGVQFESYTEAHFRTTGPAGELMLAVAAWIAKQERQRISDRTKAGMDRAKRAGKHCGRPYRVFRHDLARELRDSGLSLRAIGRKLGVSKTTVERAIKQAEAVGMTGTEAAHEVRRGVFTARSKARTDAANRDYHAPFTRAVKEG